MFSSKPTTWNKSRQISSQGKMHDSEGSISISSEKRLHLVFSLAPWLQGKGQFFLKYCFVCMIPSSETFRGSSQLYSLLSTPFCWLTSPESWSNSQLLAPHSQTHYCHIPAWFFPLHPECPSETLCSGPNLVETKSLTHLPWVWNMLHTNQPGPGHTAASPATLQSQMWPRGLSKAAPGTEAVHYLHFCFFFRADSHSGEFFTRQSLHS